MEAPDEGCCWGGLAAWDAGAFGAGEEDGEDGFVGEGGEVRVFLVGGDGAAEEEDECVWEVELEAEELGGEVRAGVAEDAVHEDEGLWEGGGRVVREGEVVDEDGAGGGVGAVGGGGVEEGFWRGCEEVGAAVGGCGGCGGLAGVLVLLPVGYLAVFGAVSKGQLGSDGRGPRKRWLVR